MTVNFYDDEPDEIAGDVVRDAVAVVRCFVEGDSYGSVTILRSTKTPRRLAAALAVMLGGVFITGGMTDPQGVEDALKNMTAAANAD